MEHMTQAGLSSFFKKYLSQKSLFVDKEVLRIKYMPETILHRQEQMTQLASILAPVLRLELPSNVFIYGKTGTGKTLVTNHVLSELEKASEGGAQLRLLYLNCKLKKVADTEYRLFAQLARMMGATVPSTGLPTDDIYSAFIDRVDEKKQVVVLALDEVDHLVSKAGDAILYNLTRLNADLKNAQISIVGITNDVRMIESVDSRVRSSLGEEELVFPPYNALELREILDERAKLAFQEGVIEEGVIAKCAAYAAKEHGDARRALDLLRVAGELAERGDEETIKIKHIDSADEKIEKSRILEVVEKQPKQSQAVLFSILALIQGEERKVETGEVFERYRQLCNSTNTSVLTQRRVSDLLQELDTLGIINAKVVSKGRYGRTREIYVNLSDDILEKIKDMLSRSLV